MTDQPLDFENLVRLMRKMAHDMRGPLGALTGTADMFVGGIYGDLSPKQDVAAQRVQRNSYRMLALLDDFMIFVKAEAEQLELNRDPFDPRQLLQAICEEIKPKALTRNMTLSLIGAEDLPEKLAGDTTLIRRVILALLWNALLYSRPGDIGLHTNWMSDTSIWIVNVHDHGRGIKPEDTKRIFEPLWRGEDRFQGQFETSGFGMGLATARTLTRLTGGQLTLIETGDTGSVFQFRVPGTTMQVETKL